ncbi:MAG: ABC transporter permease [Bryobacteraceae bacterium]|nr:ABC transporter permease [Bryobacteraceae bacterium]
MNISTELRQIGVIARLELRRAFLSKRSFWVYLLALFPAVIFFGHAIEVKVRQDRWSREGTVQPAVLDRLNRGMTYNEVIKAAGTPIRDFEWERRRRDEDDTVRMRHVLLFDGRRRSDLTFRNDLLESVHTRPLASLDEDRQVFAGVFQFFFLRVAVFFGCLGIFLNLFRGEMLDKTLHFWLLAPARREVLLLGKYLSGLVASSLIFVLGTVLCFAALLWANDPVEVQQYMNTAAGHELFRYLLATVLGCVGYGSVFLAAGLLVRNPIVPIVIVLFWESIIGFLPQMLQKLSVLYYLQSVCPVSAPVEEGTPALVRLLLSPAAPSSVWVAVLGLLGLTALVLYAASRVVRKIEIDYATD